MQPRDLVLAHLAGEAVDRLPVMPVTMMLAARTAGATYLDYCRDHRVLVDAQIRTARRFGFDHVSCISDPCREAGDLGATIAWFDDQPPAIDDSDALLADKARLDDLRLIDPTAGERMADRIAAARLFRERVGGELLIEGWVEGPAAEAADLRGISTLMLDFGDDPDFVHRLMAFVLDGGLRFARAQVDAGVDIVGVGDAAASLLGPRIYDEFVRPYETRLIAGIHEMGALARLHVCGNTRRIAGGLGSTGADIVDLDYPVPLAEARLAMGPDRVILGNLDPVATIMNGTPDGVRAALGACHRDAGPRWIVGAGCEIPRATPPENVMALSAYGQAHRPDEG
jgi:MtaA/CmuA family methyltransferase